MAEFFVYETDERMFFLKRQLSGIAAPCDIHIYAPNIQIDTDRLSAVKRGDILVAGSKIDEISLALLKEIGAEYVDIMQDEKYVSKNAYLTAEGALGLIIDHSMLSLCELRALIIGFGRIGAFLSRMLAALGADFDIATNSSQRSAQAFANNVIPSSSFDFSRYDVVINTAPAAIIDETQIMTFKPHVVYIDLASKAALPLSFAKNLGLDAEIYPALPAKTSPESAAATMRNYIIENLLEGKK